MGGDAVDDFLVDARAGGGGERGPALVLVRIILEQRLSAALAKMLGDDGVDFAPW